MRLSHKSIPNTLCRQGGLRPRIARTFPFSDEGLQGAFACMRDRRTRGKVVVQVAAAEDAGGGS